MFQLSVSIIKCRHLCRMMAKKVLVVFDFDHTLIDENSDVHVLQLLPDGGHGLPSNIKKLYSFHDWNAYQAAVFKYLHASGVTRQQLIDCFAEMKYVDGMKELLAYLSSQKIQNGTKQDDHESVNVLNHLTVNGVSDAVSNGLPTDLQESSVDPAAVASGHSVANGDMMSSSVEFEAIVVSDANTESIGCSLELNGLKHVFSKIYSNPASFDSAGCLHLSAYHHQDSCPISPANMCKGHIVDIHCSESPFKYDVVAYVGDGMNDFCPASRLRPVDVVFPRKGFTLLKEIGKQPEKIAAQVKPWDSGLDIIDGLKNVLLSH